MDQPRTVLDSYLAQDCPGFKLDLNLDLKSNKRGLKEKLKMVTLHQ